MERDEEPSLQSILVKGLASLGGTPGDVGNSGSASQAPPISIGYTLDATFPSFTEMNIVSAYKRARMINNETEQRMGWDLCGAANTLKRQIQANPMGTQSSVIEQYAGLLANVRMHVQSNEQAYKYSTSAELPPFGSPDMDFELYMTLALLAARHTSHAMEARLMGTAESQLQAAEDYMCAADIVEESYRELCSVMPPRDRVGQPSPTPWTSFVGPAHLSRAETGRMVDARARVLRCESDICQYRAMEMTTEGARSQDDEDTLNEIAEHIARSFTQIVQMLAAAGKVAATSRLARYAEFMATLYRNRIIMVLAKRDLDAAERDVDVLSLGRAMRRLDSTSVAVCSSDAWKVVHPSNLGAQLVAIMGEISALKSRCDRLIRDPSQVYAEASDRSSPYTEPVAITPLDPAALNALEPAKRFSLGTLRGAWARQHPQFMAFLSLREAHDAIINLLKTPPSSSPVATSIAGSSDAAQLIMRYLASQIVAPNTPREAILTLAHPQVMVELLSAAFNLGRLSERKHWADFLFATEPAELGNDSLGSQAAQDAKEVDEAIANAVLYFSRLAVTIGLPDVAPSGPS